jgi:hypothetical protein
VFRARDICTILWAGRERDKARRSVLNSKDLDIVCACYYVVRTVPVTGISSTAPIPTSHVTTAC